MDFLVAIQQFSSLLLNSLFHPSDRIFRFHCHPLCHLYHCPLSMACYLCDWKVVHLCRIYMNGHFSVELKLISIKAYLNQIECELSRNYELRLFAESADASRKCVYVCMCISNQCSDHCPLPCLQ